MHEMGIANSVLESIRVEALRFPGRHIYKVGLRIGELAGVDPDALSFCFEALVLGTDFEPLALEVDYRPRRHECLNCQRLYQPTLEDIACPLCGSANSRFIDGDELELAYLEVEDGARTAGA